MTEGGGNQKTILLVEDEAIIALSQKMELDGYGFNVITACNGKEAISKALTNPAPDLILMDINLNGGMDGTEAAMIILNEIDIPVVFLSSHTDPEVVDKTEKITSYGYVVKDSGITVLMASIKMAFKLFQAKKEIKARDEAIRENEERLKFALEASRIGAWELDIENHQVLRNPEHDRIFGYETMLPEWTYEIFIAHIHPKDRNTVNKAHRINIEKKLDWDFECRIIRTDGAERWIWACAHHRFDCKKNVPKLYGIVQDITDRKLAMQVLMNEHKRLIEILNVIPNGVYIVSQNEDIEYINPIIEKEFGPVGNKKCYTYFHDRSESCPWCKNNEVFAGSSVTWEWYSEKTKKHYSLFDTPLKNNDGSISKLEIFYDITELKKKLE